MIFDRIAAPIETRLNLAKPQLLNGIAELGASACVCMCACACACVCVGGCWVARRGLKPVIAVRERLG